MSTFSKLRQPVRAFTFIEMMIVVVVVGISAMMVMGDMGSTAGSRLTAAAQLLTADIGYAQTLSMTSTTPAVLVLDPTQNRYFIARSNSASTPVVDPITEQSYINRFGSGRAASMAGVSITAYNVGGDKILGFGSFGELDQTLPATITLGCQKLTLTLTIDPITSEVTIGKIK